MDCSAPGSSIHGIFQARVLEWGAIAFSSNVGATLMKKKLPFWWMRLIIGESIYVWGKESESESHSAMFDSLWPHGLYSPWNSPGQNTEVGSLSLLQGIFPTQGCNPGLPHCRWILYQLSHKGSPRILEWVTYPFSSRYSWPRNWTRVSYIAGIFFTNRAMREAKKLNESESEETLRDPLLDFSIMLRY